MPPVEAHSQPRTTKEALPSNRRGLSFWSLGSLCAIGVTALAAGEIMADGVDAGLGERGDAEEAIGDSLKRQIAQWAAASSDVVGEHGCPADDYDPF